MPIRIELLRRDHVRDGFDCGEPSLNNFLRSLASQHDARNLGRTFVAVEEGELRVLGYYTLATGKIAFENLPDAKNLPCMPVPVVLLGRLARDITVRGQKLGELLLLHALWRAQLISKHVAIYAVEVDAIDDKAAEFYRAYGFVPLLDDPRHMYLPMRTVDKLHLTFSGYNGD